MKSLLAIISIGLFMVGCQAPVDNSALETFEKNSATVQAYLEAWQGESVDYDQFFSENAMVRPTAVGSTDSVTREEMIANDQRNWTALDFQIPTEIRFLPGVNTDTREMDGSVRYYGDWTATIPATDSTEKVDITVKIYQSFDFDENGKIWFMQSYGDWGGMRDAMEDAMEGDDDMDEEEEEME